jgi:membrane protease YdiL (CAAX protease family)
MAATAILGLMMAVTYLASARSLMPAIVAHGIIDVLIEPWLLLYAAGQSLRVNGAAYVAGV